MIARDEEDFVAQALESVQSIVSEIIVVDTGSVDSTKEILTRFGAKIIDRPWTDDFSAPRNVSLEAATGDWILVLDADEAIDKKDLEILQRLTLKENTCYLLKQRHYTNDQRLSNFVPCQGTYTDWERNYLGFFESPLCRLFPNHKGLEYRGRVHELVEHSIKERPELKLALAPFPLHHYGHTPEVKRKKKKTKLYTPLGEKKIEEQPKTWKGFFELGVEHNCAGRREESAKALARAVELKPDYLPAWTNYGYVLCELGRFKEATQALQKGLELEPKSAEAHCNLAVVYMRTNQLFLAEAHLKKAIEINPNYLNAYSNLGTTLMRMGQIEESSKVFQSAVKLAPRNGRLLLSFGGALASQNLFEEAQLVYEEALRIDPELSLGWYALGDIMISQRKVNEAVEAFQEVCRLEEQHSETSDSNRGLVEIAQKKLSALEEYIQKNG